MIDLVREIESLGRARVLCIGDSMLDRFVYGAALRISPEAPVPVVKVGSSREMPGGAGNVARNIVALGARCTLLTVVGRDTTGDELTALLDGMEGLTCASVRDPERPTTIKTRYVAASQQVLRVDQEIDAPVRGAVQEALIARAGELLADADVVVLSDYAKGVLTAEVVRAVIALARGRGVPVIVDPKGRDFRKYEGATLVTPNLKELHEVTGLDARNDEQVVRAAGSLLSEVAVQGILVTRSEQGMTYVEREREPVHLQTTAREVFDVSGAGDTVIATLAAAIAVGVPAVHAAHLANLAGGIVVGKVGTATVEPHELIEAARAREQGTKLEKILTGEDISSLAARWRSEGKRVGFTNGCFDLIHPGHVSLLQQAAAQCDRLVVGLNSDASVKRLKGPERPVQEELSRAMVLAALRPVDVVVIFDEDTPARLIEAVRPDVLIKGADYSAGQVVGADFVQSYGGRLYLAELTPNQSTTRMVQRMR